MACATPARSAGENALIARVCDDLLVGQHGGAAQLAVLWQREMRRWVIVLCPASTAAAAGGAAETACGVVCEAYVPLRAEEQMVPAAFNAPVPLLLDEARQAFGERSTLRQAAAAVVDGFGNLNYYSLLRSMQPPLPPLTCAEAKARGVEGSGVLMVGSLASEGRGTLTGDDDEINVS